MANRRLFDGAQEELGILPIVGATGGAYTLAADGGTYNYSGNNASLIYTPVGSYTLTADGGTYTYSGNNANLLYNRTIVAETGTFSYSGNNANLVYTPVGAFTLTADGGIYNYSGNNSDLIYTPIGAFTLIADGGIYNYSGNNVNLFYNRKIIANNGTYVYSANNASLLYTVPGQCPTAQEIADAVWNYPLGDGYTAGEMMRVFAAVLAGKVSGAGTGTETFKSINDSKNRLVSVVDSNGNRTNITIDAT